MIFDWYKADFQRGAASVIDFLSRFAPQGPADYLRDPNVKITYLPYRWGVNDTAGIGNQYSNAEFLVDYLKNKL